MTSPAAGTGYSHTQSGPLCLILYGAAAGCGLLALAIGDPAGAVISGSAGLLIALLGLCFHHLTVADRGDCLAIQFGPIPLFHRSIRYNEIASAELGRTQFVEGWGIHLSPRGGWVWNLWGRNCVVVRFSKGRTLRIGTDDAEHLARFLQGKLQSQD